MIYITISALDKNMASSDIGRDFLKSCVAKFGIEKVKEFMEIQLMHNNELSLQLLDWLDSEFESRVKQPAAVQAHSNREQPPGINFTSIKGSEEEESRIKLPAMPQVNLEEV